MINPVSMCSIWLPIFYSVFMMYKFIDINSNMPTVICLFCIHVFCVCSFPFAFIFQSCYLIKVTWILPNESSSEELSRKNFIHKILIKTFAFLWFAFVVKPETLQQQITAIISAIITDIHTHIDLDIETKLEWW